MLVSLKSRLNGSFQISGFLMVLLLSAHIALGQANSNAADLHAKLRTPPKPLNALSDAELCPGSATLEKVNAGLR